MHAHKSSQSVVIEPVMLAGRVVRLEPLQPEHTDPLWQVAQDSLQETFR